MSARPIVVQTHSRISDLKARPARPPARAADFGFANADRVQQSLVAPLEARVLRFFARHTPSQVTPDHLTLLGLIAQFIGGVCYALAHWRPAFLFGASLMLALNWFGDSLDGTLARFRNKQRPRYGFYVDHITDTFGALFLICGLAISGYVGGTVAAGLLIGFLTLSVNAYLATYTIGTFELSHWKFSPTEMRLLLAAGNTVAFFKPVIHPFHLSYLLFDFCGAIAIIAMAIILIVSVARNTALLYKREPV